MRRNSVDNLILTGHQEMRSLGKADQAGTHNEGRILAGSEGS